MIYYCKVFCYFFTVSYTPHVKYCHKTACRIKNTEFGQLEKRDLFCAGTLKMVISLFLIFLRITQKAKKGGGKTLELASYFIIASSYGLCTKYDSSIFMVLILDPSFFPCFYSHTYQCSKTRFIHDTPIENDIFYFFMPDNVFFNTHPFQI